MSGWILGPDIRLFDLQSGVEVLGGLVAVILGAVVVSRLGLWSGPRRGEGAAMMVLGVVLFLLGSCFVVVGGTFWALRTSARVRLHRLRAAPRLSCGDLSSGTLPRRVLVTGVTAPGPDGMLVSPALNRACVWFSVDVTEPGVESVVVVHHAVTGNIAVQDRTGTVLLDPRLVLQEVSSPLVRVMLSDGDLAPWFRGASDPVLDSLERAGYLPWRARGALLARHVVVEEKVIESGSAVTVLATPRRLVGGVVLLGCWGATSVKEPDDWITELVEDIASHRVMVRQMLVVGLVMCAVGAVFTAIGLIPG